MDVFPVPFEKRVRNIGSLIYNVEDSITLASPKSEIFEPPELLLDPFSEHLPASGQNSPSPR